MKAQRSSWVLCHLSFVFLASVATRGAEPVARAVGFESSVIYRPPQKPEFAAWVQLWREPGAKGDLMVKFLERRKPKPGEAPTPVSFDVHAWERIGLPVGWQFSRLVSQAVYMRSADGGKSWREANRTGESELNRSADSGCFSPVALPDGRLLSISWGMPGCLRESRDLGTTWNVVRDLMDPKFFETVPFSMRLLRDNRTLVIFCPYNRAWGEGKPVGGRLHTKPGGKAAYQSALFFSTDFGKTLTGPVEIYQGVPVTETDFCEMPNGDLLFVHNGMFDHGTAHRQFVRKTKFGYVPDQAETCTPNAPEIFVRTPEGNLVGASRNAPYVWSDDDGATWYALQDAPNCEYQPRAMLLDDGRAMFVWHHGGDLPFGQTDEFIGCHTFKLKLDHAKSRTTLTLARVFDEKQRKYVCAFDAKLTTQDGKPDANKPVEFSIVGRNDPGYEEFGGAKPWEKGKRQTATTNADGVARVEFPDQNAITDIHHTFQIAARFDPERKDESFGPSTSLTVEYYAVTPGEK